MLERLFPQQADDKLFVEDVFSTWLYTGNGSTQTITNGIDLAGKGGLVWLKARSSAENHFLFDTNRGVQKRLVSNSTADQFELTDGLSAFNSNGFTLGSGYTANGSGLTVASWTFRQAPKFFDVVTWTADNTYPRAIPHSLGIKPGFIVFKQLNGVQDWYAYHQSEGASKYLTLNANNASVSSTGPWWGVEPTATDFTVGNVPSTAGETYVAYLFAHNTASDGIIQCGSYTGNGSATGPVVTLGWEPQWLMVKRATGGTGNWQMLDNMRGMPVGSADATLQANLSNAETSVDYISPTATGFQVVSANSQVNTSASTYIYVAIRRGPMRTPTLGTSVFAPVTYTGNGSTQTLTAGFPIDLGLQKARAGTYEANSFRWTDRLRGATSTLSSSGSFGDFTTNGITSFASNTNVTAGADNDTNGSGTTFVSYLWRRAPGFMDVVCYTGTGVARTVNHNLGVAPELMIVKSRTGATNWLVYSAALGNTKRLILDLTNAESSSSPTNGTWNDTSPTSTVFSVGDIGAVNASGANLVAYLFASCPGVSKVGSYTGNGSSQTINCAFTTGARFVLIKRTDSTGDWYVWDSARGIVAGNDPYLALNSTAAEVTSNDSVDADSTGFVVNQVAASNINVNGATYIFLSVS